MSEPATEPTEPTAPDVPTPDTPDTPETPAPETPDTPVEAPDTDPDTVSPFTAPETAGEGETFDATEEQHSVRAPSVEAQKRQQDKDRKSLEKENARHAERIKQIMGEDVLYSVACPLCNSAAMPLTADEQLVDIEVRDQAGELNAGYLFVTDGSIIGETKLEQLRTLLGIGQPSSLKPHPSISTCETCGGEGQVATGSHRQGYERIDCPTCYAKGWFDSAEPRNQQPPANGSSEKSTVTGPTVYQADQQVETFEDDPAVVGLRERGFMVIPPMTINAG